MNIFEYYSKLKDLEFNFGLTKKGKKKLNELRDEMANDYPGFLEKTKGGRRIRVKTDDKKRP